MVKLSAITIDTKRQEEGVWVRLRLGFRALIASRDSPAFATAVQEAQRLEPDSEDRRGALISRAMARHLLLGWEEIEDESGATIPYSFERALDYMTKPEFVDIREEVLAVSLTRSNYYLKSAQDAGKG